MNKKLILLSTVISLALPLNPVNAAVKAGAKCTTVGVKSVVGNKTFTCIKSGKKFVWNKGMIVRLDPLLLQRLNSYHGVVT